MRRWRSRVHSLVFLEILSAAVEIQMQILSLHWRESASCLVSTYAGHSYNNARGEQPLSFQKHQVKHHLTPSKLKFEFPVKILHQAFIYHYHNLIWSEITHSSAPEVQIIKLKLIYVIEHAW